MKILYFSKRSIFIFSFLFILILGSILFIYLDSNNFQWTKRTLASEKIVNNKLYPVKSFNSLPDKNITLLEAFKLGLNLAKKYDKGSEFIVLNSVDDLKVSGLDGRKGNWQGLINLPHLKKHMVVLIEKGKLKNFRMIDSDDQVPIPNSVVKTDSSKIVQLAKKQFNLQPCSKEDPFSHGFNFRLLRDEKNTNFLAIDGQIKGKKAVIYYNPKNGKYLGRAIQN